MWSIRLPSKFLSLSWREKRVFIEALSSLLLIRILIAFVPFRYIAKRLGVEHAETLRSIGAPDALLDLLSTAVSRAARYAPWECKCLAQAIAAHRMLHHRGYLSTLYLGIAKNEEGKIIAHAWLRCGERIITGKQGANRYTVVGTYAGTRSG